MSRLENFMNEIFLVIFVEAIPVILGCVLHDLVFQRRPATKHFYCILSAVMLIVGGVVALTAGLFWAIITLIGEAAFLAGLLWGNEPKTAASIVTLAALAAVMF